MDDKDSSNFSEITILPDGRMYVFGMTQTILELLAAMPTREECWRELADRLSRDNEPSKRCAESPPTSEGENS